MDAAPGCRLQRCSSANVLTAWPGRVAHGRHQERVAPALLGPAHHVGARRREPHGSGTSYSCLDDEVNSEIADRYTVGSCGARQHRTAVGDLPTSSVRAVQLVPET